MGHSFLRRYGSEQWSFTIRFFITAALDSTKLQAEVDSVTNDEVVKPVVTGSGAPGTDVNISFTPATVLGSNGAEVDIAWFIVAFAAGNPVLSDSDAASIDDLGADGMAGGGDDGLQLLDVDEPHILRVDKLAPSFVANGLLTGRFFDTGTSTVKTNDQTSIEVRFSEKLNVSSVSATDFTVDGLTPLNAQAVQCPGDQRLPDPGDAHGRRCTAAGGSGFRCSRQGGQHENGYCTYHGFGQDSPFLRCDTG